MRHKEFDYTPWDMSSANELCFHCARVDCREKMCSWMKRFEPVPGSITINEDEYGEVLSLKIMRCPQFLEMKKGKSMTEEEYQDQCHELIVNLYRAARVYRDLFYSNVKRRDKAECDLRKIRKENTRLRRILNDMPKQPDPLACIFGEENEQQG